MGSQPSRELLSEKITDNLSRLSIINLDFYESLDDRLLLKDLFKSLFKEGERLFFTFRREENLTDNDELMELRKKVPLTFEQQGVTFFLEGLTKRGLIALVISPTLIIHPAFYWMFGNTSMHLTFLNLANMLRGVIMLIKLKRWVLMTLMARGC